MDVTPVDRYSQGRVLPQGLQLGFAALDMSEICRGVRELAIALEGVHKASYRRESDAPEPTTAATSNALPTNSAVNLACKLNFIDARSCRSPS